MIDEDYYADHYGKHPSNVETSLKRTLGQFAKRYEFVYVGRTNNPQRRFGEHQRKLEPGIKKWDEMLVVYKTPSLGFVVQLENALISHAEQNHYDNIRWNVGGTQWDGAQEFFVYLLLDSGKKKSQYQFEPERNCYLTGRFDGSLEAQLKRLIDRYVEQQAYIYVGITNQPDRRFPEHQRLWAERDSWDRMILLYKTTSLDFADLAERRLINYIRQRGYSHLNKRIPPANVHSFCVYILLDWG